jgi:hypothetical protein
LIGAIDNCAEARSLKQTTRKIKVLLGGLPGNATNPLKEEKINYTKRR